MTYHLSHATLDEHERLEVKLEQSRNKINTIFLGRVKTVHASDHQCTITVWQRVPGNFTDQATLNYVSMPDLTLYYITPSLVTYVPRVDDWVIAFVPMSDIQNVINNEKESEISPHPFPVTQALLFPVALNAISEEDVLRVGVTPLQTGSTVNAIGDLTLFTTNFLKTESDKGDFFKILHEVIQILAAQVSPPNPALNALVASLGEFIKND